MRIAVLCGGVLLAGVTAVAQNPPPRPTPPGGKAPHSWVKIHPVVTIANLIVPDEVLNEALEGLDGANSWTELNRLIRRDDVPLPQVNTAVQDQESVLEDIAGDEKLVIASSAPAGREMAPSRGGLWGIFQAPFAVVSASQETPGGLKLLFTSLGVSSGEAFDVQVVNDTGKPVEVRPGGIVLRPLKDGAAQQLTRQFAKAGGKAVRMKMLGYCLQFQKQPPKAGMVFSIAPADVQQQYAPAHDVFRAAWALNKRGLIKPTGNPAAYYHSIRQWAWWTQEQRFTQETFTSAMLEYTKKNLANAKQPWTKEAEAYVRATAPKRWADIISVLRLAEKIDARRRG